MRVQKQFVGSLGFGAQLSERIPCGLDVFATFAEKVPVAWSLVSIKRLYEEVMETTIHTVVALEIPVHAMWRNQYGGGGVVGEIFFTVARNL